MSDAASDHRPLAGSERRPARGSTRRSASPADEEISVTVRLRRRPDAPRLPDLDELRERHAGSPPLVTRDEFAARYGADPADVERVRDFASGAGLAVGEISLTRRSIVLHGTAATMSAAFGVELAVYDSPDGPYRGREGALHLPAGIHDAVAGVFGLDDRRQARPQHARLSDSTPILGVEALTPPQVAELYDFPTGSAAGQTIGLIEFGGGYSAGDIDTFFSGLGRSAPTLVAVGVDGATNSPGTDPDSDGEVALDIDVAGSVAPGADLAVYFAPWSERGWVDVITTAVHDAVNRPSVLSISWGWAENESVSGLAWTLSAVQAVSETFQEAAALGVTVLAASGDDGSNAQIGDSHAHTIYPATDPWVTACGGTRISDVDGSSFTETTWANSDGSTGGGVSDLFPKPVWQTWAAVPGSVNDGHVGRGIPDIAGNADPASGYAIVVDGSTQQTGGTSAVGPLYAGLVALLNANLGEPVGYLNPNLYMFAGSPVYRDDHDGASNAISGAPGYTAGVGWDGCTGFGSLSGTELLLAERGVGEAPALTQFGNELVMMWKGMEGDDRLFSSTSLGTAWSAQTLILGVGSSAGPAVTVFGGGLFAAWKGILGDEGIYWSTSTDGVTWAAQQKDGSIGTSTGVSLAVFDGLLYMIWKGVEGDQRIFWRTFDGSTWTPQQFIAGVATSHGPALAVLDGRLYAAWKGMWDDQGIYWSTFDGTSWAAQQRIVGVASSAGPSLAVVGNELAAAWKGMSGDQGIYWSTFDGSTWAPQRNFAGVATSNMPGLGVYGSELFMAWKGMSGDQGIWWSTFTGSGWNPQQLFGGVGTSPDLVAAAT